MRAIVVAWSILGAAGIAISVWKLVQQPMADVGLTIKIIILTLVYAPAIFGIGVALRGLRWPWWPYYNLLHLFVIYVVIFGTILTAIGMNVVTQSPAAAALATGVLFVLGAAALVVAQAIRHRHGGAAALAIATTVVALIGAVFLAKAQPQLASVSLAGIVALLALCCATVWQAMRSARAT